jgi:hypothetical protein
VGEGGRKGRRERDEERGEERRGVQCVRASDCRQFLIFKFLLLLTYVLYPNVTLVNINWYLDFSPSFA